MPPSPNGAAKNHGTKGVHGPLGSDSIPDGGLVIAQVQDLQSIIDQFDGDISAMEAALLPTGGTTGQVLKKNSNTDHDVSWGDSSSGSVTLIEQVTLGSPANQVDFTSPLPTTYKNLRVLGVATRATGDTGTPMRDLLMQWNAAPLTQHYSYYDFPSSGRANITNAFASASNQSVIGCVGLTRSVFQIDIIDYRAVTAAPAFVANNFGFSTSFPSYNNRVSGGAGSAQTAITKLSFVCGSAVNFQTFHAYLYGIN